MEAKAKFADLVIHGCLRLFKYIYVDEYEDVQQINMISISFVSESQVAALARVGFLAPGLLDHSAAVP